MSGPVVGARVTRGALRVSGPVVIAVLLLVAYPGLPQLAAAGDPVILAVLGSVVALGLAVPLAVRFAPAAQALVAAAVLVYGLRVPPALADGPLGGIPLVGLLVVSWVAGQLGLRSRLPVGLAVLAGWVLAVIIGLDFDAPLTMLSVGWWLIGVIARSRLRLRERLDQRIAELATERDRYAAEAVALERSRIARDLHDIVAHCMTVIVIQARAGQQLLEDDPGLVAETWAAVQTTAAEAETDLDALTGIAEGGPERALTLALLDDLIERAERSGSPVEVALRGRIDSLPRPLGIAAHRVLQESVTNALRYAPGTTVRIELDCSDGLLMSVTNDTPASAELSGLGSGRGLAGLRERLADVGLGLVWGPDDQQGWRVAVTPLVLTPSGGARR